MLFALLKAAIGTPYRRDREVRLSCSWSKKCRTSSDCELEPFSGGGVCVLVRDEYEGSSSEYAGGS
jgi:hypothetical protein